MTRPEIGIGSHVWVFDINKRVYASDGSGGPIWREHWCKQIIEGETSKSWILRWGSKIPKRGNLEGIAFSEDEINKAAYVNDHRHRIADTLRSVHDYETITKIAKIIGYSPDGADTK